MNNPHKRSSAQPDVFQKHGAMKPKSMLSEYFYFLRMTKKWWLAPLILIFVIFGALILLSSTGAAPFIYTLF